MRETLLMLFVAIALTRAGSIYGQDRKWTLEECINQAIAHNIVTKQSQNEINNLKVEQSSIKNSLLPNLNAGASQRFAFGRSLNQNNTYENSNIQSSSFSISTEMNLFAGFRTTTSISQKKMDILAAEANKELIENNLSLNVTSAYYQILLDKEIYSIAQQQIVLTKEQAYRTELLIESGKVAQAQLFDIKAQLADDELTATEAKNQLSISLLELIQLMELEGDGAFDIDSLDEDIVVMNELNPAAMYDAALECMPQIRQAYYRLKSKSKEVKIAKSGYYPTLSIGAGIATGYYYTERGLSDPFKYQFDNNMQKSIYMTLTIPLFDRFNTRNQARGARINENSAMLSLEDERKKLYKEIEKAYTDVLGSFEKYKATSRAVKANEEAHRYALEKYATGKSTPFEYNEIKMKLADALSKQSQAKYAYLLRSRILSFYSCHSLVN